MAIENKGKLEQEPTRNHHPHSAAAIRHPGAALQDRLQKLRHPLAVLPRREHIIG